MSSLGSSEWSRVTANGRRWRLATEDDLIAIGGLFAQQEARIGKQDRPDLFEMPVLLTLVAEDETGKVVQALYGEVTVELTSIGLDRASIETVHEIFPDLQSFFRSRSIRYARVFVPKRLTRLMRQFLPGLVQLGDSLSHFVFRIR